MIMSNLPLKPAQQQNIYLAAVDHDGDNTLIMLSIMELFARYSGKIALFRPIIDDDTSAPDPLINFISHRYQTQSSYESMYGCKLKQAQQMLAADQYNELLALILAKYRALSAEAEHILCVGTDFLAGDALSDFEFNSDVANNFDCQLIPVLNGHNQLHHQLINKLASLKHVIHENNCNVLAIIINGIEPSVIEVVRRSISENSDYPVYLVPRDHALETPTINNIRHGLAAHYLAGERSTRNHEVKRCLVAAMMPAELLASIQAGDLIITSADRLDLILACLYSYQSEYYPAIAGLLITDYSAISAQQQAVITHLTHLPFTLLAVETDTYATALAVSQVKTVLNWHDDRKIAKALSLIERHLDLAEIDLRLNSNLSHKTTPLMFQYELFQRAKAHKKQIVLPEGNEERVLRAAEILVLREIVDITLLGNELEIRQKIQAWGLKLEAITIIDPLQSDLRPRLANAYYLARKHKGMIYETAFDLMADVSYFGTMLIQQGLADGMVSGAVHSTQHTLRPAFEVIKTKPGIEVVSSIFFMCLEDSVVVYGDCAVNVNPDAQQLASIAISAAETAKMFNIEPKIAMLSYSTGDSGKGEAVDKVREAVAIARALRPDLKLEGPIQFDAAVDPQVAKTKLSASDVAGQATVFIFPDLNTGNNTYKAVQRSSGAVAIGPILQGLNKPVNDLSRGCTVTDIVNTVVITAIQAQEIP